MSRSALCRSPGCRLPRRQRKGIVVVLVALLLPVSFILSSFVINIAYLQLSRTELMIATDAAARAGGRAMSHYQDIDAAKAAAQVTAAMNTVAGAPLRISFQDSDNEIEFGDSNFSASNNRFEFSKIDTSLVTSNVERATSVRVNGRLTGTSLNGTLQALFPPMGLRSQFNLEQQAVATQLDRDIALILDRSGSMGEVYFDWPYGMSPWTWGAMNAAADAGVLGYYWYRQNGRWYQSFYYENGQNSVSYQQWVWTNYYNLGPAPQRPWDELVAAVDTFLEVLEGTDQNEQISLATYASSARLDLNLISDYDRIHDELESITPSGMTAIGQGLQTGLPSLLNSSFARPFAAKTIIVMTDGIHNSGIDPVTVAQQIASQYNFTIHTITFGDNADQNRMRQVAQIGGGEHYHAATGQELQEVFEEIANNLPTLITQ